MYKEKTAGNNYAQLQITSIHTVKAIHTVGELGLLRAIILLKFTLVI